MKNDIVLVVGGDGFIGEHFVAELLRLDKKVLIFDRKSKETIDVFLAKVDIVAFLAPPDKELLQKILKILSKKASSTFLYTSTLLLYEGGKNAKKENDQLLPISIYAKEKRDEEEIIFNFIKNYPNINVIIARLGNVYGDIKNKGFIGLAFAQFFEKDKKKEIVVSGNGTQVRDYVFVDDVARVLSILLFLKSKKINVVNISTGIGHTLLQIIQYLEKITQKKLIYSFQTEVPETYSVVGDNKKLHSLLGWVPDTLLKDGLSKTYKRYIIKNSSIK